jgi:hypothetical protein
VDNADQLLTWLDLAPIIDSLVALALEQRAGRAHAKWGSCRE